MARFAQLVTIQTFLNLSEFMHNWCCVHRLNNAGFNIYLCDYSFSSSRLSYIGSFKQRVKTTEGAIISQKPKAGSKRFVLLVDIDCFFAAVALKNFPEYKNCPVAVGHSPTVNLESTDSSHSKATSPSNKAVNNSSSELSTCNYIARKFGVRKGMFLGDAIKVSSAV